MPEDKLVPSELVCIYIVVAKNLISFAPKYTNIDMDIEIKGTVTNASTRYTNNNGNLCLLKGM